MHHFNTLSAVEIIAFLPGACLTNTSSFLSESVITLRITQVRTCQECKGDKCQRHTKLVYSEFWPGSLLPDPMCDQLAGLLSCQCHVFHH